VTASEHPGALPVPHGDGVLVVPPPVDLPGYWSGAPSAIVVEGEVYLSYRLRQPEGVGRGYANVVARSRDGVSFETVAVVEKDAFGAESLERPALVVTEDGRWRLYVSCATPGTKHWWVEVLEADTPEGLATAPRRTVLPGDALHAVKDPVVVHDGAGWHLWASVHPLDDPDATDRMTTEYATSPDGLGWTWQGTALAPRAGAWDARGVRISAVFRWGDDLVATYDGRATAEENWEERTGLARPAGAFGRFVADSDVPAAESRYAGRGLRYLAMVDLPGGVRRLYWEATRADGAHELRTDIVAEPAPVVPAA
jgi:hypothetical protein